MTLRIFVPSDTTACSLGADAIAAAIELAAVQNSVDVELIRNGSRGLLWLEPMVEVETPTGRVAYGPVNISDVDGLLKSGLFGGNLDHPLCQGLTEEISFLKNQQRLTFARLGLGDPLSIEHYLAHDGFRGLQNALSLSPADMVQQVTDSGLRGRGGAAFPTGIKWKTVLDAEADQKYIVCNDDEGYSGTFADRLVMECDPSMRVEGMDIEGLAGGAK